MYKKNIMLLVNISTILMSSFITGFVDKNNKQSIVNTTQNEQAKTSNDEFIKEFSLHGLEENNTNEMIEHSAKRRNYSAMIAVDPNNKKPIINLKAIINSPLRERNRISLNELRSIQNVQDHIHRVSNNSVASYLQFTEQVLAINSPEYYKNSAEIISDFENLELRDGVKTLMDLQVAFEKTGADAQNIVNMYNYLSRFYGKEHMKKWLFTLLLRDDFPGASKNTLGVTGLYSSIGAQYVSLRTESFDKKVIQRNFNLGWFASNNSASTFIHEYGHVLENALQYLPGELNKRELPEKKWFKGRNLPPFLTPWLALENQEPINSKDYASFENSPTVMQASEEFVKFIAFKLGFNKEQIKLNFREKSKRLYSFKDSSQETIISYLIAQLFVDGNYGKTNLREQFAEMFAYWLWKPTVQTDSSKYSIRWTVINEFFLDYLPKNYQLAIKINKEAKNV